MSQNADGPTIEPCLIPPLDTEYRILGPCAKRECRGTIHATATVISGRVERRQFCTSTDCNGTIPLIIDSARERQRSQHLPDLSPPDYLGGTAAAQRPRTLGEVE